MLGLPRQMPRTFYAEDLGEQSWDVLSVNLGFDQAGNAIVPVIVDQNTARYGLGLYGGVGEKFTLGDRDRKRTFQVVGLLKNSFFQGALLLDETELLRLFPGTEGYQYFLIDTSKEASPMIAVLLEDQLADYGFDAEPVVDRLAALYGVQNTYLATFQSLGGLGLLLGTLGLLAVQLRNVFSRRREFALLQACGFSKRRLSLIIILESILLLTAGLLLGVIAAGIALLPHWAFGGAKIPWFATGELLLIVVLVGMAVGFVAVRQMVRLAPIVALRGE